jgi:hypothetical protein
MSMPAANATRVPTAIAAGAAVKRLDWPGNRIAHADRNPAGDRHLLPHQVEFAGCRYDRYPLVSGLTTNRYFSCGPAAA